jgi:Cu(I)/Ag(I) efflux system membrane fusion protein
VVYVEVLGKERPTYEAREVRLGPRAGEFYPVVSGLEENERVVIRGAFRLDSDLQLRGGHSMMARDDDRARAAAAPIDVPEAFHRGLAPVLEGYLALHVALSKDDLEGAREAYSGLAKTVSSFRPRGPEAARKLWSELGADLAQDVLLGGKAKDLENARRYLESVSTRVIQLVQRLGNPLPEPIRLAYCPMAAGSKGAFWLQKAESIENPYFGASMFKCGEVRESVPSGKHLDSSVARSHDVKAAAPAAHEH